MVDFILIYETFLGEMQYLGGGGAVGTVASAHIYCAGALGSRRPFTFSYSPSLYPPSIGTQGKSGGEVQRGKEMANLLDLLSFKDLPPSSFISYCGPFDDKLPKHKLLNAMLATSGGKKQYVEYKHKC